MSRGFFQPVPRIWNGGRRESNVVDYFRDPARNVAVRHGYFLHAGRLSTYLAGHSNRSGVDPDHPGPTPNLSLLMPGWMVSIASHLLSSAKRSDVSGATRHSTRKTIP